VVARRATHADPTFEAACRMEIRELGCKACVRRLTLSTGAVRCSQGKEFPRCKGERKGFKLDEGGG
jgi:hypothetical protein